MNMNIVCQWDVFIYYRKRNVVLKYRLIDTIFEFPSLNSSMYSSIDILNIYIYT